MSAFDWAFGIVVGIEGGYVNDPKDPGGETRWGISRRAYPEEDIPNLTIDRAKFLYKRDYWDAHHLDDLEPGKALLVFSTAVLGGNHARWYSMYGGETLAQFAQDFQAERILYLASLPGWSHDGRGWSRRLFKEYGEAINA